MHLHDSYQNRGIHIGLSFHIVCPDDTGSVLNSTILLLLSKFIVWFSSYRVQQVYT